MNKNKILKKGRVISIIVLFIGASFVSATGNMATDIQASSEYSLPPPLPVDMVLEESIFRRMSVREFTEEPVTDEALSTILYAAYGVREDGKRTVSGIDGMHAAIIYVLREDAAYKYNPLNHSLVFFKEGDYRNIVGWQYEAPVQLGLCWNKNECSNENYSCTELGQIGQNIQFMANAMGLGTVVTGEVPSPIENIDLPSNEVGKIVMPLGHPKYPYDFTYVPMWLSFLPRIQHSDMSLSDALEQIEESIHLSGKLTRQEQSQVIWSSYGYSYLLDNSESDISIIKRHRTVPSAHGYYPLRMYAVTESGVYRYIDGLYSVDKWGLPVLNFLLKIRNGDYRDDIAHASQSFVASAPLVIISVLDIQKTIAWDDLSDPKYLWVWYFEAGASAHNVLLESAAQDLSANIVFPLDIASIRSTLKLNEDFIPFLIVSVGR